MLQTVEDTVPKKKKLYSLCIRYLFGWLSNSGYRFELSKTAFCDT